METKCWIVWFLIYIKILPGISAAQVWIEKIGLEKRNVTSISIYDGILAAGTNRNGVYWQTTNSPSDTGWTFIGLDSVAVFSVYAHKGGPLGWSIAAGIEPDANYPDFIYCSFLGGAFQAIGWGIEDSLVHRINELDGFADPTICGETYAAAGRALYRRNFGDTTWVPLYIATIEGNVQTVKAHDQYPGVVLAGGGEGFANIFLIKSLDFGDTWENISPFGFIIDVDFAGDSAQTIFASSFDKVFRSQDTGKNWKTVFDGQGKYYITRVIYDPSHSVVYIAGGDDLDSGNAILFVSNDLGETWQLLQLSMNGPIVDLELERNNWIYCATFNFGIFRIRLPITTIQPPIQSEAFHLSQNYPNPFNPSTTIEFVLPNTTNVTLKIYNILGEEVAKLVSDRLTAESYSFVWDAGNLTSGIYLYRIVAGEYVETRKMILMR
jgi:hypothetical protein